MTDKEFAEAKVFEIDEGFGETRLTVRVFDREGGGPAHIQIFDTDRDAIISIDEDIWLRIARLVGKRLEDRA